MLLLDTNVIGDYLNGEPEVREFLTPFEQQHWITSPLAVTEIYIGCLHGHVDVSASEARNAILSEMEVVDMTERTAYEALRMQGFLMDNGYQLAPVDLMIAASAVEHGAIVATTDSDFWDDTVKEAIEVAEYYRDD